MNETISISCTCGKKFQVPRSMAGKKARCKLCGNIINIQEAEQVESQLEVLDDQAIPANEQGSRQPSDSPQSANQTVAGSPNVPVGQQPGQNSSLKNPSGATSETMQGKIATTFQSAARSVGLSTQRLAIVCAAGVGMLAIFLPWVEMPWLGSVNGTHGAGWLVFFLFGATLSLAIFAGKKNERIFGRQRIGFIAPALVAGILGLIWIFEVHSNHGGGFLESREEVGFGLYLVVIAAIGVVTLAFALGKTPPDGQR